MSRRVDADAEAMRRELAAYPSGGDSGSAFSAGLSPAAARARAGRPHPRHRGHGSSNTTGDDDGEDDPSSWVTSSRPRGASAREHHGSHSGGHAGHVSAASEEAYARELADRNLGALRDTHATLADAQRTGEATAARLAQQGEQLRRVEGDLDKTNHTLSLSQRVLGGMQSFGTAFANMFTSAPKPLPAPEPAAANASAQTASARGSPALAPTRGQQQSQQQQQQQQQRGNYSSNGGYNIGSGSGSGSGFGAASAASAASAAGAGAGAGAGKGRSGAAVAVGAGAGDEDTLAYVRQRRAEEEAVLDDFANSLEDLKRVSLAMNSELKSQAQALDRIDDKMALAKGRMTEQTKTMDRMLK